MPDAVTILKCDHAGRVVWQYDGVAVAQGAGWVCVEARFNRDDHDAGYMVYRRGDRFVEWFYADRWYNVFRIHDVADDRLKGWYCNLTRPARIDGVTIAADDLALDVFVSPGGAVLLLDEDEYAALPLTDDEREQVTRAIAEIRALAASGAPPFDAG